MEGSLRSWAHVFFSAALPKEAAAFSSAALQSVPSAVPRRRSARHAAPGCTWGMQAERCGSSPLFLGREQQTVSVSETDTIFGRESLNQDKSLTETGSIPTICGFLQPLLSPVPEIISTIGRSWASSGGKPEGLGSWGFSWCGKSPRDNNPVQWALCHPRYRHPGTLLGFAPSVICLQILWSHHRYGARCDGKDLRRLPGYLPALIP